MRPVIFNGATVQLLPKTVEAGNKRNNRHKLLKEKCAQTRIVYLVKYPSEHKGKTKTSAKQQRQREFTASLPRRNAKGTGIRY